MKIDWKALWEAVKEPLRWLALAVIPFALAFATSLPAWLAGVVTIALRVIDGYLHEQEKAGVAGGLVRF